MAKPWGHLLSMAAAFLSTCGEITSVVFSKNNLGGSSAIITASFLSQRQFMTDINFANNQIIGGNADAVVAKVLENTTLTQLNISNIGLREKAARHIWQTYTIESSLFLNIAFSRPGGKQLGVVVRTKDLSLVDRVLLDCLQSNLPKGSRRAYR